MSFESDSFIRSYNYKDGNLILVSKKPFNNVSVMKINRIKKILIIGDMRGVIHVLNLSNLQEIKSWRVSNHSVKGIDISQDGEFLITFSAGELINLWRISNETQISQANKLIYGVQSAFIDIKDGYVYSITDNTTSNFQKWKFPELTLEQVITAHNSSILSLSFNEQNLLLATASGNPGNVFENYPADPTIKIWSMPSMVLLRSIPAHSKEIYTLSMSPDGQWLVSSSDDGTIKGWKVPVP